jgi:UDP-3-O-[3-hydroxymyristoyl] N-acetylglucosamine deacetylase
MDGLPYLPVATEARRTLKTAIGCVGAGVHTGQMVNVVLHPAEPGTGIVLRRTDLGVEIPARHDHVVETRLSTALGLPDRPEARVGTVEHLIAALAGCRVADCIVDLDGPEVPILDGSAAPWVFLLDCAGLADQGRAAMIEVLRPVRVTEGEAFAELRPGSRRGFTLAMSIAFDAAAIGRQALTIDLDEAGFRRELAPARTFGLAQEVAALRSAGLARGGSLRNAVVVDGARVLNPGGLRMPDEFVRHKLLDAVGDLALAGAALAGRFVGHCSGHALNNRLLRALFASPANWRLVEGAGETWSAAPVSETAAAA